MSAKMRGGVREPHMSRADLKKSLGKDSTVWRLFGFIFKNYKVLMMHLKMQIKKRLLV